MPTNQLLKRGLVYAIIILFIGVNCSQPIIGMASEANNSTATKQSQKSASLDDRGYFYAYNAYDPNGMNPGEVTFDMDAVVNLIGGGAGISYISGEDIDTEGNCYGIAYYGGLYSIDLNTGDCTLIASTIQLNSLVYDTTTGIWYTCTATNLDTINIATGFTTLIGPFGSNITMSILMVDISGDMYGFGASGGNVYLYVIDKTTGVATPIWAMGLNYPFLYPEGATFDRNDNTLYVTAYDIGQGVSYLATCDLATGAFVFINQFSPTGIEIVALAIPYTLPDHILIADFTWTPVNPHPSETIVFNASASYDSDGYITLYEWDWNNDGMYEESHTTPTATHSWNTPGNYPVWLQVTDNTGLTARKVKVVSIVNHPPEPPIINGPTNGRVNHEYTFSLNPITDPDGDSMYCKWDWGDGNVTGWLGPYPSGQSVAASHTWIHPGVYEIRAKLKDTYGAESNWSDPHTITILDNKPPATPTITGSVKGKPGVPYVYAFNTTDPENDEIYYFIDWGDNTSSGWLGPYSSGDVITKSHTWSIKGTYDIRAKAKDIYGNESNWSTLTVTMPMSYEPPHFRFFAWLFERFPDAFTILRYLLGFNQ